MDPFFLRPLVEELNQELNRSWVVGIYPLDAAGLFLQLASSPGKEDRDQGLYISLESQYPCIYHCHLAEEMKQATRRQGAIHPEGSESRGKATRQISIIKTLKKYLHKARLMAIQPGQGPSEVIITFYRPTSSGQKQEYLLVLCLAKGHPQVRLVTEEGQRVLAQYGEGKDRISSIGKVRVIDLPNHEALAALLHPWEQGDLVEKLMEKTQGLSRLWARELYWRAESQSYQIGKKEVTPERLFRSIKELDFTLWGPSQPRVVEKPLEDGSKELLALTPVPMIQFPLEWQRKFPTLSRAAHYYYENKIQAEHKRKIREEILKVLRREEKRLQRLKQAQEADRARGEAARDFKLYGELINAQVKAEEAGQRGQAVITLTNYYQPDSPPLEIPLDPTMSLRQNAQRYFRLYQKAQRGQKIIERRLSKTEAELQKIETPIKEAEHAKELQELTDLREMLAKDGWLGKAGAGFKPAPTKIAPTAIRSFHRFTSSQGYEILVGKNARENDHLTFGQAAAHDLWLHAQGFGGAHVVIRSPSPKTPIPDKTLEEAAQLAVYFSRARGKGKIKVIYAQAKEVKKPKGAKAGLVTVGRYRTMMVDTDKEGFQSFKV